ncbi:MAG: hypothetical protein WCZ17_01625 [Candidatus Kapaibacterium sp.]|jgi:hypothetical protein
MYYRLTEISNNIEFRKISYFLNDELRQSLNYIYILKTNPYTPTKDGDKLDYDLSDSRTVPFVGSL